MVQDSRPDWNSAAFGRSYRVRSDAVELDPVELRLTPEPFQTALLCGFFGALRDALLDDWGRQVIERKAGLGTVAILCDSAPAKSAEQTLSSGRQVEQLQLGGLCVFRAPDLKPQDRASQEQTG